MADGFNAGSYSLRSITLLQRPGSEHSHQFTCVKTRPVVDVDPSCDPAFRRSRRRPADEACG
jgi:hypothetical protein